MRNKKLKIAAIAIAVFFILSLMKNAIVQVVIHGSISSAAHVPVRIQKTRLGLLSSSIRLDGLKVYNPKGFSEKVMVDAPLISASCDLPGFFKGQAHFRDIQLDIKEVVVVKNREGRLNIDAVKPTAEDKKKRQEKEEETRAKQKPVKLKIDALILSIGRVVYKDYSAGGAPKTQVFEINMRDRVFTDIHDPATVVSLVMFEALTRTTLSRLLDLDLNVFKDGAVGALDKGLGLVSGGSKKIENTAKDLLNLFN